MTLWAVRFPVKVRVNDVVWESSVSSVKSMFWLILFVWSRHLSKLSDPWRRLQIFHPRREANRDAYRSFALTSCLKLAKRGNLQSHSHTFCLPTGFFNEVEVCRSQDMIGLNSDTQSEDPIHINPQRSALQWAGGPTSMLVILSSLPFRTDNNVCTNRSFSSRCVPRKSWGRRECLTDAWKQVGRDFNIPHGKSQRFSVSELFWNPWRITNH